jgi:hypothetical protein
VSLCRVTTGDQAARTAAQRARPDEAVDPAGRRDDVGGGGEPPKMGPDTQGVYAYLRSAWVSRLSERMTNVVMDGFRAYSSFRPTPDGCCAPGTGGWVKSHAQRGRGSDAVGALDAVGGTRMMGGQEVGPGRQRRMNVGAVARPP